MAMKLEPIDRELLYSLSEAAQIIPGMNGRPLHPVTLLRWCKSGRIKARQVAGNWFIEGHELARVRDGEGDR